LNLEESILFGHKKGAFTGAVHDVVGKFEQADNGTLFLDELADLSLPTQAKLLRVLEDGLVEPIGARKSHRVDVRIVAATNRDLVDAVRKGGFRPDLYYRLSVGEMHIPPLRDRRSDISKLALNILDGVNRTVRKPRRLSPEALSKLEGYTWPGNVRELRNAIERSIRLCRKDVLDADDLLIAEHTATEVPLSVLPEPTEGFSLERYLADVRRKMILRAMELADGNLSKAGRLLGITPQAVHNFIKRSKDVNKS
jgi:two-component system NtrC family response regulator